jgi:hypothetical protein
MVQLESGIDAVARASESDIHNHQIGPLCFCQLDRLFSRGGKTRYFEAGIKQGRFNIHCDQMIVFDNEYLSTAKLFSGTAALGWREHPPRPRPLRSRQINPARVLHDVPIPY